MEQIKAKFRSLKSDIQVIQEQLEIARKKSLLAELTDKAESPDFWSNTELAQKQSRQLAKLQQALEPWLELDKRLGEIDEFIGLDDDSLTSDLESRLEAIAQKFESLKKELRFSGKHDEDDAILSIQSGAGGTDAQDWAEMLLKMYVRWVDNQGFKVTTLAESIGDEAGIKSASLHISGPKAYGKLKSEHGVHRLVRLSPFNSANSRETSFAIVEVVPEIEELGKVEINPDDLKIDVYRAGGRGGQSVNTTDSAVRVTHLPTGTVVAIQNERSQTQNKATALKVLRSKLAQLAEEQHIDKISELKGPNVDVAWGNQIRSYVLHPYTLVKDNRTGVETGDVDKVLSGDLDMFIEAYLEKSLGTKSS